MSTLYARLVSFGLGGHLITCKAGITISGYDSPKRFLEELENGHYTQDRKDPVDFSDCMVLDKCDILRRKPMLAIASPLPEPSLESGAVDYIDTSGFVAQTLASDPSNGFGSLVRAHETCRKARPKVPGPLDKVSIPDYVQWWRQRGARVGRIQGSTIVWEA